MEDTFWSEIYDAPGEIFDIPEMRDLDDENKFNIDEYINANYEY